MQKCPRCNSLQFVKNGTHLDAQRYRCKPCGYQFTRKIRRGRTAGEKALAMLLHTQGLSMNAIAKLLGVSPPAVSRWVRMLGGKASEGQELGEPVLMDLDKLILHLDSKEARAGTGKLIVVLPVESLKRDVGVIIERSTSNPQVSLSDVQR